MFSVGLVILVVVGLFLFNYFGNRKSRREEAERRLKKAHTDHLRTMLTRQLTAEEREYKDWLSGRTGEVPKWVRTEIH